MNISRGPLAAITLTLAAVLTLGRCAAAPDTDDAAAPSSTATDATATDAAAAAAGDCSGVSVVVDFGALSHAQ